MEHKDYKVVHSRELSGTFGTLGIKILVKINRELVDDDSLQIREATNLIQDQLINETLLRDKKLIEQRKVDKANILDLFIGNNIFSEEIENEYYKNAVHEPWYRITTPKGRIKIGWRKRVINIDWSDSIIKEKAEDLFHEEDVTKGEYNIHAWDYDKARNYIKILLNS